ncbi:MAG TPA: UDP-N-acetylglucosamine 1-carboxyvinyltransferase, partial [Acidimicrobiales bacterium]|nr:UDP-N-acetylglucosamine 1-carboxyvinyltransferase [Acidimicrobiales bacterium]
MERLLIQPSGPLSGSVAIDGAKNSALKLMAATLLAEGQHVLRNVPDITDVTCMADVLRSMGLGVERRGDEVVIDRPEAGQIVPEAPWELVERMRASTAVLGPLLARFGRARVALPGGDDFGPRPVDLHVR